ncbi:MAG: YHYH protein [Leptospiraceae bacterium]|nr:YHYH protein [Leptospiraceae bacterium]
MKSKSIIAAMAIMTLLGTTACDLLSSEEDDTTTQVAVGLLALSSSSAGCNSCVTNNDTALPAWIKDNFKCMTITVEGSNYVFRTSDLPPYTNGYYNQLSGCYTNDFPSGNAPNPNTISSQNIVLTIPSSPDTTESTTDYGAMGVAINGVALYNSEAAPGDTLAAELDTMDSGNGHPTNIGQYHYHTEPYKISSDDSALIGIALDGYPIFGRKEVGGGTPAGLDTYNGHSHAHPTLGTTMYHYHVETSSTYYLLIGSKFKGTKGTSN